MPARKPLAADGGLPALRFAPLLPDQVPEFTDLIRGAYPLFMEDRDRSVEWIRHLLALGYPALVAGTEKGGRIIGGYAYFTFVATLQGRGWPATGLGMVATALDRKKQHVALAIVRDYLKRSRAARMPLTFLYPFRHDFYAGMGWSPVAETRQYALPPSALPLYPERTQVRQVREPDWQELDRIRRQALGARGALGLSRHSTRWSWLLRSAPSIFVAGGPEQAEGYLIARFSRRPAETDSFRYDLEVSEMEWTTPAALRALLGFLSSQRDQVVDVILDWPADQHLDAILHEPVRRGVPHLHNMLSHGPVIGMGAMLRLDDPQAAFADRPCAAGEGCRLEVATADPLERKTIRFRAELGDPPATGPRPAVRLACGLGTLARLWAGSLRVREAVEFGLAEVTPAPAAESLDRLLAAPLPWITERF